MKTKKTMRRAQSRGHSGFARVLTMLALLLTAATGAWAQDAKHLITATYDKQTRSLEQPLPYATTIGALYEAVTGEPISDLISSMFAMEKLLNGIGSTNTDVVSIGELNGASTSVTVKADGKAAIALNFSGYVQGIFVTVTPPLYVTMKDGVKDADKWTVKVGEGQAQALPIGGLKGDGSETVTLQYSGDRQVKSVKATSDAQPAGPKAAKDATAEDLGKVIGADGNIYDDADAATAASTTAVAKIFYVGSDNGEDAPYNHGLALALGDVSDTKNWCSQTEATCLGTGHQFDSKAGAKGDMAGIDNTDALVNNTGHTHDAASAARNYNSGTHPAGTSAWFLPSAGQWDKMATAAGSYANLINNAGLQGGDAAYWSSTEGGADYAWLFDSSNGDLNTYAKDYDFRVRSCLAF